MLLVPPSGHEIPSAHQSHRPSGGSHNRLNLFKHGELVRSPSPILRPGLDMLTLHRWSSYYDRNCQQLASSVPAAPAGTSEADKFAQRGGPYGSRSIKFLDTKDLICTCYYQLLPSPPLVQSLL